MPPQWCRSRRCWPGLFGPSSRRRRRSRHKRRVRTVRARPCVFQRRATVAIDLMRMVADQIQVGRPLPFAVRDDQGHLLLAKGRVVASDAQLRRMTLFDLWKQTTARLDLVLGSLSREGFAARCDTFATQLARRPCAHPGEGGADDEPQHRRGAGVLCHAGPASTMPSESRSAPIPRRPMRSCSAARPAWASGGGDPPRRHCPHACGFREQDAVARAARAAVRAGGIAVGCPVHCGPMAGAGPGAGATTAWG